MNLINNLAETSTSGILNVSGQEPFYAMKVLANAIKNSQHLNFLSEITNTILYWVDIFLVAMLIVSVLSIIFSLVWNAWRKHRIANDETVDFKTEDLKRKQKFKASLIAGIILIAIFGGFPFIMVTICGFISIS